MRIIHVIPSVSEEAAGPSYSVRRLCQELLANQQDIILAALHDRLDITVENFHYFFPRCRVPYRLGRSPKMAQWMARQAQDCKVDILHSHSLWMMPNVYPGRVAKSFNIPYVVSPRGTLSSRAMKSGSLIKRLFWPLVQWPALSAVTCFHATALAEYEDIRKMGFRQPVAIIPNGMDVPILPTIEKNNESYTLLFLGRIHPIKGLDVLLAAWQAVQDRFPQWRLRIVGPDNRGYLEIVQQMARDLVLKRVEFAGPLYGLDKWRAYQEADLFVLPTYSENFGVSVAEALAAGTPAIVSKGAPWEGLNENRAGWWIDIGVGPLASCFEVAFAQSVAERDAMSIQAKQWIKTEFSWSRLGTRMVETYDWLLHGGNKPDCVILD